MLMTDRFQDGRGLTSNSASDSCVSNSRNISSPGSSVSFNPNTSPKSLRPENSFRCERPLESNVVLDVYRVACGVKHAALVTSQVLYVENFILVPLQWLGNFIHGEMELATLGFLVMVPMSAIGYQREFQVLLSDLQVSSVTCGPSHTALITSTLNRAAVYFGDGKFGVLGHGVSSGKLLTHGGMGQKSSWTRRQGTDCVPELIDYSFYRGACAHSLTAGLTTSGNIFTMGSSVYGQLGNPLADRMTPCLGEDKLSRECVEEIACGAYHVATLCMGKSG
ncbi:hypothetical protein V6N13_143314 [Hibiscus sabdariffa]|uniref:Uncharacterized protein n=1 Tax=Hibiscus sabdariffa TaxID=183260 RepID=A0ABR2FGX1_9ROSI